jgi:RNA polymerase sigma-70 factor, ECF subfamily
LSEQQQAVSGDSRQIDQFMALFTRYQRHVYCYVRSLVSRSSDLEEIVQQTNTVLWEKFGDFEVGSNFLAWALTIARFEVWHYRARQSRSELLLGDALLEEIAIDAANHVEFLAVKLEMLADCRKELSSTDSELLDRRYAQGASSRSVAIALGKPVVAVYKSLSRIRKRLFDCIEKRLSEKGAS